MVGRKNQLLLRLLKLRIIVDGMFIYPLEKNSPISVNVKSARPRLVITDGFHYTKSLEIVLNHMQVPYYTVACVIEDEQLLFGALLLVLFYTAGITSNLLVLKLLSFLPLVFFLLRYYQKRDSFLQLRQL